ncbi:MAG: type II and III secretion system family protein [Rhodospirillales bacterium]|nr:type II and III secretion system family protein [Rhodospirillales bacterium]
MFSGFKNFSGYARISVLALGVMGAGLTLAGCDLAQNQLKTDRAANMEFQDFRDGMASRLPMHEQQASYEEDSAIPELQSYVAQPSENLKPMPLVSISVNQTVPLRDVLFELAKQADYDVELDPRIVGSIIFTAREKPFDVVVRRIAEISGLRYSFDDDVLRVELDKPYTKTYKVDYLSYIRKNNSSVRNNIAVVTGEGADTGSKFEMASESEADFWGELTAGLEQILGVAMSRGNLKTENNPQIAAVEKNPAPVEPVVVEGEGGEGQPTVQVQPPEATLQVSSLPSVDAENSRGRNNRSSSRGEQDDDKSTFSVNRQAGMISVYATERQHKEVVEYLTELKRSATSQVLIEAKVLEVSLSDKYNTGINWSKINLGGKISLTDIALPTQPFLDADAAPNVGALLEFGGNDVNAIMQALSEFGTVRALASPRMTVLNNQSAVLNVAQNLVYFELEVDTTTDNGVTNVEIDTDIRNVPEGVMINMQPSIDLDGRKISMAIRPTITNVEEFEDDPGVAIQAARAGVDVSSSIPVVQVQEFDSVISMNSGEAVLMGGLMQDRQRSSEQAVPLLSEIPVLGSVFRSHVDNITKTELIVFLRATIVDGGESIHNTDREIYKLFSSDRRPLDL